MKQMPKEKGENKNKEQMLWDTNGAPMCVPEAICASDRCQHCWQQQARAVYVPVADWTIPICSGNVTSTGQIGSCPSSHQVSD